MVQESINNLQKIQSYLENGDMCCLPIWWQVKLASVSAYLDLLALSLPEELTESEDTEELTEVEESTEPLVPILAVALEVNNTEDKMELVPPTVKMVRQI